MKNYSKFNIKKINSGKKNAFSLYSYIFDLIFGRKRKKKKAL